MSELTTAEAPRRLDGTRDEFVGDLRMAIGAWRVAPWLPVVGTALWAGGGAGAYLPGSGADGVGNPTRMWAGTAVLIGLLAFAVAIYSLGWAGSERATYRRIWNGRRVTLGDALNGAFEYIGRFLVLGLICYLPVIAVTTVVLLALDAEPASVLPVSVVLALTIQALLTFVTPALAYDEERATRALRVGARILRAQGRRSGWYVLVPAVVQAVTIALSALGGPVAWIAAILSSAAHVALRGAIAAAYLRLTAPLPVVPIEPSGSPQQD